MMEAQTRYQYQYQERYQEYGLDMSPEQKKRVRTHSALTSKDKTRMLMAAILIGVLCVCMIIAAAYAASLKYDINRQIMANNELQKEVEILEVKIESANNLRAIEEKAVKKLGMVPAEKGQIIYLSTAEKKDAETVAVADENAYN